MADDDPEALRAQLAAAQQHVDEIQKKLAAAEVTPPPPKAKRPSVAVPDWLKSAPPPAAAPVAEECAPLPAAPIASGDLGVLFTRSGKGEAAVRFTTDEMPDWLRSASVAAELLAVEEDEQEAPPHGFVSHAEWAPSTPFVTYGVVGHQVPPSPAAVVASSDGGEGAATTTDAPYDGVSSISFDQIPAHIDFSAKLVGLAYRVSAYGAKHVEHEVPLTLHTSHRPSADPNH